MSGNLFELAIIAFIFIGIAVAVWKGGAANPESTGSLGKKINTLDQDVKRLDGELKHAVAEVDRLNGQAATKADIKRLERKVDDHCGAVEQIKQQVDEQGRSAAAREATLDHVKSQVDRLYDFIVNKGMSK